MVVVFIPPAVDAGLPPINISIKVSKYELSERLSRLIVEKPAVLGVVELKNATSHF